MSTPLLPCPFCGGSAKVVPMPSFQGARMVFMHASCQRCGASGPTASGLDPERATGFWNDRVTPGQSNPKTLA